MNLADFLARVDKLKETDRYLRLARWGAYYAGKQYDARDFDVSGCLPGTGGVPGFSDSPPSWSERKIEHVYNLPKDVVRRLASWAVCGESWCTLEIPGDEDAQGYLNALVKAADLRHVTARVARRAGGQGAAYASAAFRAGVPRFEVHAPEDCWVLRWADRAELVPAEVVKIFVEEDPFGEAREPVVVARYWTAADAVSEGEEAYLRRVKDRNGKFVWETVTRIVHGLARCPVFLVPNGDVGEGFEGLPDFAGSEGEVDDANELLEAASFTTKRNAEDTLVLKMPSTDAPTVIRKGAFNAIVAEGGADYLTQKGDSAKISKELAEGREAHVYRLAGVVKVDADTLGRATTGEALKRLYAEQINAADEKRGELERWFVRPACGWLLDTARALAAAGQIVKLDPKVETDDEGEVTAVGEHVPGTSSAVVVTWPQAFPPGIGDLQMASEATKNATGGKQVMSRKTAVLVQKKAGSPVTDIDAELEAIAGDEAQSAEHNAASLGLAAEATAPFQKAGPV